jgi:hypothetical protein
MPGGRRRSTLRRCGDIGRLSGLQRGEKAYRAETRPAPRPASPREVAGRGERRRRALLSPFFTGRGWERGLGDWPRARRVRSSAQSAVRGGTTPVRVRARRASSREVVIEAERMASIGRLRFDGMELMRVVPKR